MSKHRFRLLEMEMIRRGVALRHARRAALELECHYRDLAEQALARGESPEEAERSAQEALGADAVLIERYAAQLELQGWTYRWRAAYVLAPLVGFAAAFALAMLALVVGVSHLPGLHHGRVPRLLTHEMDVWVSTMLLWVMPVAVAMGFGALAGRQQIAFRWLSAGIVVLGICTALMNVRFVLTGGSPAGLASAGIGFSTANAPQELLRMADMVALTLVPAAWLRYRAISRQAALE